MFLFIRIGRCATTQSNWICIRWMDRSIVCYPSFSNRRSTIYKIKKKPNNITLNIYTLQLPDIIWIWKFQFAAGIHHEVSMGNVWFLFCLHLCCFMLLLAWHFDSVFICRRVVVWSAIVKVFFYIPCLFGVEWPLSSYCHILIVYAFFMYDKRLPGIAEVSQHRQVLVEDLQLCIVNYSQ